jgi:hypothetical protein
MRRLKRIEAAIVPPARPERIFNTIIDDADPDARIAEWQRDLIASGQAVEADLFIAHVIVSPPNREARANAAAP